MNQGRHTEAPVFEELIGMISDRAALRKWATRAEVRSIDALLDAELTLAPITKLERWSALLSALNRLRALAQSEPDQLEPGLRRALGLSHTATISPRLLAAFLAPAPEPKQLTPREGLQRLGGIASARAIAQRMAAPHAPPPTVREVRDRLRNAGDGLRKLGAGYYALSGRRAEPVQSWAEARLRQLHREPVTGFCRAVLATYPHGDVRAISAWLHQSRGPIVLRREAVCYVPMGDG